MDWFLVGLLVTLLPLSHAAETNPTLPIQQFIHNNQFHGDQDNLFIRDFVPSQNYSEWLHEHLHSTKNLIEDKNWLKLSSLNQAGQLIHHARLSEGYTQIFCKQGPNKNNPVAACDSDLESGGAHAVELEYYARVVLQGRNFHPIYQSMARLMLLARSNFVFNENPLRHNDMLVVRTAEGLMRMRGDERKTLNWRFEKSENFLLKKTSAGAALLNLPDEAWVLDLRNFEAAALNEDYSQFKLLKADPPEGLIDLEEVDTGTHRYFVGLDSKGRVHRYNFESGRWKSIARFEGAQQLLTTDPTGTDGLYMRFTDGSYCSMRIPEFTCVGERMDWPKNIFRFLQFQDQTLKLSSDGRILEANDRPWQPLSEIRVWDVVKVPRYDVFN